MHVPTGDLRLGFFKDGTILGWDEAFAFRFQLSAALAAPAAQTAPALRTFACTRDGRWLLGGGRSAALFVWDLATERPVRLITLPAPVQAVRQVQFLWAGPDAAAGSDVAAVLATHGVVYFVHVHECRVLATLGLGAGDCDAAVDSLAVCPNGKFLAALLADGTVTLFNLHATLAPRAAPAMAPRGPLRVKVAFAHLRPPGPVWQRGN
jgi:WD40 repeat protein